MPDFQYQFVGLGVHHDSHAARLGVLWPAIGRATVGTTSQSQLAALPALLLLWRGRISQLHREGYSRVADPLDLQYARNCLPTMAEVVEPTGIKLGRECKLRDLCPWCYSRRIIVIYRKIKDHVSEDDKLFYARYRQKVVFPCKPEAAELKLLFLKYRTMLSKLALANSKTSHGIYWLLSLSPTLRQPLGVTITCGIVAIMPKQETFDLVPRRRDWKKVECVAPKVNDIVKAVSRAFHYPPGLLKGDAGVLTRIMEAREKLRLSDSCGCFRGG